MKKSSLFTFCLAVLLLLFGTFDIKACSCMVTTTCEAYARAEFVFVGRIIKAAKADGSQKHQVQVEENFLGLDNNPLVDVFTDQASSCAFKMDEGKKYLIFARRNEETGAVWTGMCSKTSEIEFAKEDLEFLRSLKKSGKTGGTIKGKVLSEDSTDEEPKKPEQVDKVFVESEDGEKLEAAIEPDGKYEIGGLKKGKYKIYVTPPKGYTTNYEAGTYIGELESGFTEVARQGCFVKDFIVKINGVISGKVFDADGIPVKERRVNLFRLTDPNKIENQAKSFEQNTEPEDGSDSETLKKIEETETKEFEEEYTDYTDEDGSYNFRGLPPGRYLLGFEIEQFFNLDEKEDQYLPTYFPGLKKKENAVIIELKKAQVLTDRNIQLFPKLKKRNITGQVVLKNGRPVTKIESSIYAKREGNSDTEWFGDLEVDEKGRFSLLAFEETEYLIQVRFYPKSDKPYEGFSNKCFIIPKNGQIKPVKIILDVGTANCDEQEFRKR